MRRGTRNPRKLKVRCYAACLIGLNEYFYVVTGSKGSDKIGEIELNEILFNSMQNGWSKKRMCRGFIVKLLLKKSC